jgi:hypothetical protein
MADWPNFGQPYALTRGLQGIGESNFDSAPSGNLAQFSNSDTARAKVRAAMQPVLNEAQRLRPPSGSPQTAAEANNLIQHAKLRYKPLFRSQPETIPGTTKMAPDPQGGLTTDQVQTVRNRAFFTAGAD